MTINPDTFKIAMKALREDLGDALVTTDIWAVDTKPVAHNHGYNTQPKALALFSEVTRKLDKTLKGADFPGLGNYYFINLANNRLAVVLSIDTYQQFILVDLSRTTMGILMSVALPNLLNHLVEAETKEQAEAETEVAAAEVAAATAEIKAAEDHAETETPRQLRNRSTLREFLDAFTKGMYYKE